MPPWLARYNERVTQRLSNSLVLLFNALLAGLIFVLPSHFFFKWAENQSYVRGLLIDYLLPKIYLSDVIMMVLLVVGLWYILPKLPPKTFNFTPKFWGFFIVTLVFLGTQAFATYALPAMVMGLRLCLFLITGWVLVQSKSILKPTWILGAILATLLFQSVLGLYQFEFQQSFVGYLLLGEPKIPVISGLAQGIFGGALKVLPYGTTAHPNVLAGVLAVYSTVALSYWTLIKKSNSMVKMLWGITVVLSLITLALTQSVSGYVALGIGLGLVLATTRSFTIPTSIKILGLLVVFLTPLLIFIATTFAPTQLSLSRRNHLNQNALHLIQDAALLGVGLMNNAAIGENLSAIQESVRFAQPTHNLPLLWASETGLLGCVWLIYLLFLIWPFLKQHTPWWLLLVPLASLDHYLLTTEAGLLLMLILITGIVFPKETKVTD